MNNWNIVEIDKTQCRILAESRLSISNGDFIYLMGPSFFQTIIFAIISSKYGIGLTCENKDSKELAGFLLATTNNRKLYKEIIIKAGMKLLLISFFKILTHPTIIFKVISSIKIIKTAKIRQQCNAEWLTLIINSKYQGKGFGKLLTNSLINAFKARGIHKFISTVPYDNKISNMMHEKLGFRFIGTYNQRGIMNVYIYNIN
jgi:ribosomal protein S18 acetylase RimI-like enzyme